MSVKQYYRQTNFQDIIGYLFAPIVSAHFMEVGTYQLMPQ